MLGEERRIVAIVRLCAMLGEAFQGRAGAVADARGEGLNALHKARPHVGAVQQHPRQPQHHVHLGGAIKRQCFHGRPQGSGRDRGLKIAEELGNALRKLATADLVQPSAKDAQKKQPLPKRVRTIANQSKDKLPDGPEPRNEREWGGRDFRPCIAVSRCGEGFSLGGTLLVIIQRLRCEQIRVEKN